MKSLPAEYRSLRTLAPEIGEAITPLIQLWDREPSAGVDEEGEELEPPGEDLGLIAQQTVWDERTGDRVWRRLRRGLFPKTLDTWPRGQRLLLDGEWLDDPAALGVVIANARALGMDVIPVTGLARSREYRAEAAALASPGRGGLVVKLASADFVRGRESLRNGLAACLRSSGGSAPATDLVLDLRYVDQNVREREESNLEAMLRIIPDLDDWRNIAVTASGAPQRVAASRFPVDEITPYPRPEWWIWRELRSRAEKVGRLPVYGDYATLHPERIEAVGERKAFARIPQIRYASGDTMLMMRGHDLRPGSDGREQMHFLLERLKNYGASAGADFSAGDHWLEEAASGRMSPGLWATWKWAGQVHGITYVVRQLSNLDDP